MVTVCCRKIIGKEEQDRQCVRRKASDGCIYFSPGDKSTAAAPAFVFTVPLKQQTATEVTASTPLQDQVEKAALGVSDITFVSEIYVELMENGVAPIDGDVVLLHPENLTAEIKSGKVNSGSVLQNNLVVPRRPIGNHDLSATLSSLQNGVTSDVCSEDIALESECDKEPEGESLPCNSFDVPLENLVLDQHIFP